MSIYQDRPLVAEVTIWPVDHAIGMDADSRFTVVLDHQANAEVIDVVMRLIERRNHIAAAQATA